MQDLNDMVLFAEVMEHGGFSAAGRALDMPKSRVSRRIANLERQLGLTLMHRSSRKLSLTPDGEVFLRHCREMRHAAQHAFEAVAHGQSEPRGRVRLSCPITLALSTLATALPRFMDRYPRVQVDVTALNRPVDPIVEGVDLSLRVRQRIEDSAELVARPLGTSHAVLVGSPDLLKQHAPIRSPQDLDGLPSAAMSVQAGRSRWDLLGPDGEQHVHWHTPRYIADDLHMMVCAAVHGIGIAVLPHNVCREELRSGQLIRLLPAWEPPTAIIHVVFPAGRTQVPAVRALVDFLIDVFRDGESV